MTTEMIILSVAIIAIGVGVIAYVLLHAPKDAARIGDTPEISLGEMPEPTEGDITEEAPTAEETPAEEKTEE